MDNYRCYLTARVWIFKSFGQEFFPILFIPWVHQSVPGMETLMVAPLVTLVVMLPFLSIPAWSVDLIWWSGFIFYNFFRFLTFLPTFLWGLILLVLG